MLRAWKPMTRCNRGDVVLVVFPNSDGRTYTKRPALVVQADDLNTGYPQKLVALITSNLKKTGRTRLTVLSDSDSGRKMGLRSDSVIVADNIATVQEREMDKVIGNCAEMETVDQALRITLAL